MYIFFTFFPQIARELTQFKLNNRLIEGLKKGSDEGNLYYSLKVSKNCLIYTLPADK